MRSCPESLSAKLYINGISSSNPYSNPSANTYLAVYNTSGNTNYTSGSVSLARKISKATISQTLKSFPSSPFTYDGTAPTIQDTLNESIVSGNTLSFNLINNSVTVVSTSSSSTPFNFSSLPGKYAAAGSYSYTSTSSGNGNYTVVTSPALSVTIDKASPVITLTSTPSAVDVEVSRELVVQ